MNMATANASLTYIDMSVIIPFKDKATMTLTCVRSLCKYGPRVREILLISNNSSPIELDEIVRGIAEIPNAKLLIYDQPFNYQKINNWAVGQSSGNILLFLNNDIELVSESSGLLEKMASLAAGKRIGMVGCLLLYGDKRTIQHAGVHLTPRGLADHIYVGRPLSQAVSRRRNMETFPYDIRKNIALSAVTGAAQMVETVKFNAVNGFDERFIICGGDVDLCLRLNEAGYQTTLASGGHIIHKESQSRSFVPIPYSDFYNSYLSYINGYDTSQGDPFVPLITKNWGA
jgi:GT2 family glycosyltransferase